MRDRVRDDLGDSAEDGEGSSRANRRVAGVLERVGELLEAQRASAFRVAAWRGAAAVVRALPGDVRELVREEGIAGLDRLPGIGRSLAAAIEEVVRTGRSRFLAHLEAETTGPQVLTTVPGIGPALARRIVDALDVHTLEELELAAHDGRLESLRGIGPRRARAVRESLEVALRGSARRRAMMAKDRPPIATLLAVDAVYRGLAARDELPKIAPRRFNPTGAVWLPVMHIERDGWHFTALFSNTARAHALGKTHDWVVIYAEHDGRELQHTVVTETHGPMAGMRVVRGRETELRSSDDVRMGAMRRSATLTANSSGPIT